MRVQEMENTMLEELLDIGNIMNLSDIEDPEPC